MLNKSGVKKMRGHEEPSTKNSDINQGQEVGE